MEEGRGRNNYQCGLHGAGKDAGKNTGTDNGMDTVALYSGFPHLTTKSLQKQGLGA